MTMNLKDFVKTRNEEIYRLFMVEGKRQKFIADQMGLSESRVKKIIGELKKSLAMPT